MFQRSVSFLLFTLSLCAAAAAEKPLELRLPTAEVDGKRYQRTELLAALFSFSANRGGGEPARALVLLWEDGRVLWSEDPLNGGPPYRTGLVTPTRAAAVAGRVEKREGAVLTQENLGPDGTHATLILKLRGGRYAQMKSWHPREPNAKTVATSRGLQARDGRDPAAVLAADTAGYQAFRRVWQELEDELVSVAHVATGAKPTEAKLEWGWLSALPPVLHLRLRLERAKEEWQFVLEGPGVDEPSFATVAELRTFLGQQPKGTVVTWDPGCKRMGTEPLLSNDKEMTAFKAFFASQGLELVILKGG